MKFKIKVMSTALVILLLPILSSLLTFSQSASNPTEAYSNEVEINLWDISKQEVRDINEKEIREQLQHGAIIELKDEPLVKLKNSKDAKIQSSQDGIDNIRDNILENHENAKQKILEKIGKAQIQTITNSEAESDFIDHEYFTVFNGFALNIPYEQAKELLKGIQDIKGVYPNYEVKSVLVDSAPQIGADKVWELEDKNGNEVTGKGITVAVIDTGIDYRHPDLGDCTQEQFLNKQCSKVISGYDFVNSDSDPIDDNGHGTHVAGIAAGKGVFTVIIDGVKKGAIRGIAPDAYLLAYKVLDSHGNGKLSDILKSIEHAVDPNQDNDFSDHANVITLSLGVDCFELFGGYDERCGPDDALSKSLDNAVESGSVVTVAAGNSGKNPEHATISSPGTSRKAITVGAVSKLDEIAEFSSHGPVEFNDEIILKPDVVAPGVNILAPFLREGFSPNNWFAIVSGTSQATPHAAGTVALLLQMEASLTPDKIKSSLIDTALDLGENRGAQGYGRIDALGAIKYIADKELPTITFNTQENQWFKKVPTLDIDFSDNKALDNIFYQFDGINGIWQSIATNVLGNSYTNDWSIDSDIWNNLEDGIHYIYFKITDKAGNEYITSNNEEAFTIKKDSIPPNGGSITYSDGYYTTRDIILNLNSGADSGSGLNMVADEIQKQEATLSNGVCAPWSEWYSLIADPIPLFTDIDAENGKCYRYRYSVLDNVGNERIYDSANIAKIDTTKLTLGQPEIYLGTTYTDGTRYWYTGTIGIRALASDSESGIAKCEYTTDGFRWHPIVYDGKYCKKESIEAYASWQINFIATNGAGFIENTGSERIYVYDPSAPITSAKIIKLKNNNRKVTISCDDKAEIGGSGCSKTYYCVDNSNTCEPSNIYYTPFKISAKGKTYIRYKSEDNLGNIEAINTKTIRIK